MSYLNLFLVLFYSIWILFTLLNQFSINLNKKWKKFDIFNLVPKWTFFAPNPLTVDICLLYREINFEGEKGPFIEYPLTVREGTKNIFFNPKKRAKKSLQDLVRSLSRSYQKGLISEKNMKFSIQYISILNYLTTLKKSSETKYVQFLLVKTSGLIKLSSVELILVSDIHPFVDV